MPFGEFVALLASLMAIGALAIDSMLPALPVIGQDLGVGEDNRRQLIVTVYLLGFGTAQLVYGPLADRFGRKPLVVSGIVLYAVFSGLAAFSTSFGMLLAARALMGLGGAATRVLVVSMVRDCYVGREMARVMSITFVVFLVVPITAPTLGQAILAVGSWRWIFGALACFSAAVGMWIAIRLPETLDRGDRRPLAPASVVAAFRTVLRARVFVCYALAMTLVLGTLFGYVNSAQQIFADALHAPRSFTLMFACVAAAMAVGSYLNADLVRRFGPRRVSRLALIAFVTVAALHAALAISDHDTLASFVVLQAATMFVFGLTASNLGTLAMAPFGRLAGTASSVLGFTTIFLGGILGYFIGHAFDGTTVPASSGFTIYGLGACACVAIAERSSPRDPFPLA